MHLTLCAKTSWVQRYAVRLMLACKHRPLVLLSQADLSLEKRSSAACGGSVTGGCDLNTGLVLASQYDIGGWGQYLKH